MIGWQKADEITNQFNTFLVCFGHKMGLTCGSAVNAGAAKVLQCDGLPGHILDNFGACDDHLTLFFHHDDEIRQCR